MIVYIVVPCVYSNSIFLKGTRMNERIRELALQAGDYANAVYTGPVRSKTPSKIWEDGHIGWHELFNKKFAELIIREYAEELRQLNEGERVVLPKNREHAQALVRVGMHYLEQNK